MTRISAVCFAVLYGAFTAFGAQATHVFWYKAGVNGYNLQESGPGPAIAAGAVVHEGVIMSSAVAQHTGNSDVSFYLGNGLNQSGRCGVVWSQNLCEMGGAATLAKFRGEFRDGYSADVGPWVNPGLISIRCGVADFQANIDVWGTAADVSETATWQDFLNPLGSTMGYDMSNPALEAEETISYTAPASRPAADEPSVLDGQYAEIDVTDQVNWILAHTGSNKGSYSGQYAIVFLSSPSDAGMGKLNLYGYEDCVAVGGGSDNPWTQDGNTIHLVVEGDLADAVEQGGLHAVSAGLCLGRAVPNPFTASTAIAFDTGLEPGKLAVYGPTGRLVYASEVDGAGSITWNAGDLANGVYFCRLTAGNRIATTRLVLTR